MKFLLHFAQFRHSFGVILTLFNVGQFRPLFVIVSLFMSHSFDPLILYSFAHYLAWNHPAFRGVLPSIWCSSASCSFHVISPAIPSLGVVGYCNNIGVASPFTWNSRSSGAVAPFVSGKKLLTCQHFAFR